MKLSQILLTALLVASVVFAQEAKKDTAAAPKAKPAAAAKALSIKGSIVSIDAVANTLIVKVAKKDDTLTTNADTKVKITGKDATLADLKADANVTVTYKAEEGKKVATEIVEKAAATKKAETKAAPAAH